MINRITKTINSEEFAGFGSLRTGNTITNQADLLHEQVKMLAGEVALSTSSLKRLSDEAANNPDDLFKAQGWRPPMIFHNYSIKHNLQNNLILQGVSKFHLGCHSCKSRSYRMKLVRRSIKCASWSNT